MFMAFVFSLIKCVFACLLGGAIVWFWLLLVSCVSITYFLSLLAAAIQTCPTFYHPRHIVFSKNLLGLRFDITLVLISTIVFGVPAN